MKRFLVIALSLLVAGGAMAQDAKKLVVWSFTDELQKMMAYYQKDNPDVKIEFTLIPNDVYQSKLKPVLQSGQGAPDVFSLEAGYVKGYVGSGWMGDLTALANGAGKNTIQYTKDVVTDANGKIHGMSWQATPGAFFYRRSLAKQYLGTDDPVKVQAMIKDLKSFVAVADKLKVASKGSAVMIASTGDLFQVFKSGRKAPWVVNNTLIVDPVMTSLLDTVKLFHDKGYEGRQGQWSEGWFAGMKGTLKDEKSNPISVFGYLLPTWGLPYVLKQNAPDTSGDWAMVQGPIPYFWGGTWLTMYSKSKMKPEAQKLIEYLTTNDKFLTAWAKDTGDFVSKSTVVDAIKGTYSEAYLGGQNHYAQFAEMAKNVSGKVLSGYDQEIETIFQEQMTAYQNGEKDKATAIKDFKEGVSSQFPDLKVN